MDYKVFLEAALNDVKHSIKHYKALLKERKAELKESEKTLKLAKDELEVKAVEEFQQHLVAETKNYETIIKEYQHKQERIERTKKMDLMQLENGVIVDVAVLRKMHKKFKVHKLSYEYELLPGGLNVHYCKGGVKGCLQLYPIEFTFPIDVDIPQLKEGETLA